MGGLLCNHPTPIGLDLGAHSIKAVQLLHRRGSWEALAAVSLPRTTPGAELSEAELLRLREVLRRHGFIGKRVNVALEPARTLSGMLELPARAPGLPMEEIAQAEFCRVNKVEPAELVMSYWDLPAPARASRATYVMAVGCRGAEADAYLDLIESGGFEVDSLDACGFAAPRACAALAGASGMTAVFDVGWRAVTVSILKAGVVLYERRVGEAGLGALLQSLAADHDASPGDVEYVMQRIGMADDSAAQSAEVQLEIECRRRTRIHFKKAAAEFQQALAYAEHQYADAESVALLLTGGGAMIPGLAIFLEETLKCPVKIANAGDVVKCPVSLVGAMTSLMMNATGLAQFEAA